MTKSIPPGQACDQPFRSEKQSRQNGHHSDSHQKIAVFSPHNEPGDDGNYYEIDEYPDDSEYFTTFHIII